LLNLASIAFTLQRESSEPLFVQLCDQIRQRITAGSLAQNTQLPPSRGLATDLGISRSTVVVAYEQLVAEGYIEGRSGSGYFVRGMAEIFIGTFGACAVFMRTGADCCWNRYNNICRNIWRCRTIRLACR